MLHAREYCGILQPNKLMELNEDFFFNQWNILLSNIFISVVSGV